MRRPSKKPSKTLLQSSVESIMLRRCEVKNLRGALLIRDSNFAGVIGPQEDVAETDVKAFERCMAVNTTGVFLSTKHELKQMMTQSSIQV
jgi:hypothetical protein